jgi:hypothetical protein
MGKHKTQLTPLLVRWPNSLKVFATRAGRSDQNIPAQLLTMVNNSFSDHTQIATSPAYSTAV